MDFGVQLEDCINSLCPVNWYVSRTYQVVFWRASREKVQLDLFGELEYGLWLVTFKMKVRFWSRHGSNWR